ncbi:hypothetical protein [Amycolatopsis orientalis]|uniref:hypothetical protein n=1 Tax=Amycolatopsis orientalis TaxID=31958 RepID=UPI0003A7531A|nr:hypothetical protein [Amycolatopsis orientalis]
MAKALELLERAVKEKGADYLYPRTYTAGLPVCAYERNGKPSCLVGTALSYTGVTVEQLREMDAAGYASFARLYMDDRLPVELTDDAVDVFQAAQTAQDIGDIWGTALEKAREEAAEIAKRDKR